MSAIDSLRRMAALAGAALAVLAAVAYVGRLLRGRAPAQVGGGRAPTAGRPLRVVRGGAGEG